MNSSSMVQGVTTRLYHSLNIEESLHMVLSYIESFFPIDNIHTGVFNSSSGTIRYLASSTREGGILIDETIQLSKEAAAEGRTMMPGKVLLLNNPLEKKLIREVTGANMTTEDGSPVYDPGSVFSAMTLVLDIGYPLKGMCTMIVKGKNLYTKKDQQRFKTLAPPMTNAIFNLLKHREILDKNETLIRANQELRQRIGHLDAINIIGARKGLRNVMLKAAQVAPKDSPVLITGETGTGKEVLAHSIHKLSSRSTGPMVCINCGAIHPTLLDSELFGHEKGSFTGAVNKKRGYFEQASGGTIFLDEVAELPLQAQVKLLRVIQEKTIFRVGGTKAISVNARIIAATHRNLEELILKGEFREDLWFRLNVFPILIPPLRNRKEDIPELVDFFMERKSMEMHLQYKPTPDKNQLKKLIDYPWPGNIRELENIIERSLITSTGHSIEFPELSEIYHGESQDLPVKAIEPLDKIIIKHIQRALIASDYKISGDGSASEMLGLNPSTLRGKIRKYGIDTKN